jgi:hypothetical protein
MCNLFISHKHEDAEAARQIKDLLQTFGEKDLNIFISEDILPGENWREVIVKELSKSNLLLLLFTEARLSWDWCLYETGLFMGLEGDDRRKVICIHTPLHGPPDQIKHLEAIPAQDQIIKDKFLKVLFGKTNWTGSSAPINANFAKNEELLDATANNICSFFEPKQTETKYINRYFKLLIIEPDKLGDEAIPTNTKVFSKYLDDVFGVAGDECNWWLLAENQKDPRWIQQLENAIKIACKGRVPEQIQATFLSRRNEVIRPILYRVDMLSNGAMQFYVLLVPDVSSKSEYVPPELKTIATVLSMSTRFRYEVIEGYHDKIRRAKNDEELNEILDNIRKSITTIESEAGSRLATINELALRALYKKRKHQKKILQMFDNWHSTKNELFKNDGVFEKDRLLELFSNLRQMNCQFMHFTSQRYKKLIKEKCA